jgi:hypothetical protein
MILPANFRNSCIGPNRDLRRSAGQRKRGIRIPIFLKPVATASSVEGNVTPSTVLGQNQNETPESQRLMGHKPAEGAMPTPPGKVGKSSTAFDRADLQQSATAVYAGAKGKYWEGKVRMEEDVGRDKYFEKSTKFVYIYRSYQ